MVAGLVRRLFGSLIAVAGIFTALPCAAQTLGPTHAVFAPSADHAVILPDGRAAVSRYELALYCSGQQTPVATVGLGKPTPVKGFISVEFRSRLLLPPPSSVRCAARVLASGPGGTGQSKLSNEFTFEHVARDTPGDVNGDGGADFTLFRYSDGTWIVRGRVPVVFGQIGDIPVAADYDGVAGAELAVFRPGTAKWMIQGRSSQVFGVVGDVPVPADYDGDGAADVAVFRPSTGSWLVQGGGAAVQWGRPGDIPVPGDYDGDGRADLAVFRPSTGVWYIGNMSAFSYGRAGDIPVPADYDGDGTLDPAVYRPSTGTWHVRGQFIHRFGARSDLPVPQDLNGDGRAELVVWRPGTNTWHALHNRSIKVAVTLGAPGDLPAMAPVQTRRFQAFDADGDRKADIGVFRAATRRWHFLGSRGSFTAPFSRVFGVSPLDVMAPGDYDGDRRLDTAVCNATMCRIGFTSRPDTFVDLPGLGSAGVPVPGDYDGDGRTDLATFLRGQGLWRVFLSSTGFTTSIERTWGRGSQDIPVPGDFDGDGRSDFAVFRPRTATWYIAYSKGGAVTRSRGRPGDHPLARDFDGDGRMDLAVFRPSTRQWFIWTSSSGWSTARAVVTYGQAGDVAVPADYTGDGRADIAVFRPSTGYWYLRGLARRKLGSIASMPIPGQ